MAALIGVITLLIEHALLFGDEIGKYIWELHNQGVNLYGICRTSRVEHVIRPEGVQAHKEIMTWFTEQPAIAEEKFLKYLDFTKP